MSLVMVYWYIGAGRGHGIKTVVSITSLFASSLVIVSGINTFSLIPFYHLSDYMSDLQSHLPLEVVMNHVPHGVLVLLV